MGASSKGGGAQQSHDYYGTVLGVIGIGPITEIQSILLNGTQVFGVGFTNSNGTAGAPLVYGVGGVGEGYSLNIPALNGNLIIHWGLESATPDSVLNQYQAHPPYKGYAYVVLDNCLFGTEQETAPNLEFIITSPCNQSIVTGASAAVDSQGNVNAVAMAAELATSWAGLNLPSSMINTASFQTVADSIRTDSFLSQIADCSPFYNEQTEARDAFGDMQCGCDLWFGFDSNGLLECGQWFRNGPTGSVTVITANEWTTPPADETDDITQIPTAFDITFADETQLYTETSAPTNNVLAVALGAIGKRQQLRRTQFTSVTQAHVLGGEALRLQGNQTVSGQVVVRATQAVNPDGSPIRPGSYFELDTEQEPGSTGELQLCRCTGRTIDPEKPTTLQYEYDPGAVPIPYSVPYSNNAPNPITIAPLPYQRTGSFPPVPGQQPSIFVLAQRADPTWVGIQVYEDTVYAGDYTQIGTQIGFALPCGIQSPIAATDTVITVNEIANAGIDNPPANIDIAYLSQTVGVDSDSASRNNALLCVLVKKVASTGAQVMIGTVPWLEICSVVESTLVAAGQYQVTLLRGRMGTVPLAFDTAGGTISFPDNFYVYEAWFIPSTLLTPLYHTDFATLAATGGTAYFEFAPFTKKATYNPAASYAAGLQPSAAWDPIWAYVFPSGYTQGPVVTISAPTAGATSSTAGALTLSFTVADPTNSSATIVAYAAMSADGSQYTSFLNQNVLNDGSFSFSQSITLPAVEGLFTISVQATNKYGVSNLQTVQVYRAISSSGFPLAAPIVTPPGMPISGSTQVTITKPLGASGTSQIEAAINGGSWVASPAASTYATITVLAGQTLTCRMMDTGPVYSAVVTNQYPNYINQLGDIIAKGS